MISLSHPLFPDALDEDGREKGVVSACDARMRREEALIPCPFRRIVHGLAHRAVKGDDPPALSGETSDRLSLSRRSSACLTPFFRPSSVDVRNEGVEQPNDASASIMLTAPSPFRRIVCRRLLPPSLQREMAWM